jgi:hypothetical protein
MDPIAGKCVLILDGRRVAGAACAIDVEGGEEAQQFGFLSAPFEVLKEARSARRVEVELDDGRIVLVSLLQVHATGIALIAMNPQR